MIIIPGYNFTVNEVPTRAKFQLELSNMSLTGIALDNIDPGLIGIKYGATEASTPTIGWLRSDFLNRLWIRTAKGEIPLWRANWGGWETNRFRQGNHTSWNGNSLPMHARGFFNNETAGGSLESLYVFRADTGAAGNIQFLKVLDSGISGFPIRVLGRGGSIFGVVLNATQFKGHPDGIRAAADGDGTNYTNRGHPTVSIADLPYVGEALSFISNRRRLGWFFGAPLAEQ